MDILVQITSWITEHWAMLLSAGGVLEVVLRLFPSDKVRSMLSYAGRLIGAIATLMFKISDLLSKIIPDRPATPK